MATREGLDETEALRKLAFFECFKCKVPYYGGRRECAEEIDRKEEQKAEDFICAFCKEQGEGAGLRVCKDHGETTISYKCRYCCSLAVWYCYGTTHFCEDCHNTDGSGGGKPCLGVEGCPFQGCHAPNGEEFALGCDMCNKGVEALPEQILQELQDQFEAE